MKNYIISCCSTADLSKEHFDQKNIPYATFHFSLDDVMYDDDLGQTMSFETFYKKMEDGAITKTSQVNVDEFLTFFRPFLENGQDILHLTLSSGISGVYNSACIARDMLLEEYPDRKFYVIDSLCASTGLGLLMDDLVDKANAGMDIDTLYQWTLDNLIYLNHWFTATDLTYLIRGGRVSKTAGAIGNLLNICPVLNVSSEGKLIVRKKVRTAKKAIKELFIKMQENVRDGENYNGKCYICHSACYDEARGLADLVEANFPNLDGPIKIYSIGTVIGSHTGPGTIALFFWGNAREI